MNNGGGEDDTLEIKMKNYDDVTTIELGELPMEY